MVKRVFITHHLVFITHYSLFVSYTCGCIVWLNFCFQFSPFKILKIELKLWKLKTNCFQVMRNESLWCYCNYLHLFISFLFLLLFIFSFFLSQSGPLFLSFSVSSLLFYFFFTLIPSFNFFLSFFFTPFSISFFLLHTLFSFFLSLFSLCGFASSAPYSQYFVD